MGLKDIGSKLPPGFRFHPSDEELVCHYLCNKVRAKSNVDEDEVDDALIGATDLVEIDLHICEPWQLPDVAKLNAKEWYFFSFRDRKYATGYRTNRATISGYWKATGKDRIVMDPSTNQLIGMRKTLVFYKNRAPNGIKTTWIMHEFRLECPNMPPKEDWVLCRVFNKGRDSSPQDNSNNNYNQQTQRTFEINDASDDLCYNNQLKPLLSTSIDLPHHQWEQLMKQPSRTIEHPYHHYNSPCDWEQITIGSMSSSSNHGPDQESLLNLLYAENNSVNITEDHHMVHEKTCMESSSDGGMVSEVHMDCCGLSFETDNLLAFH